MIIIKYLCRSEEEHGGAFHATMIGFPISFRECRAVSHSQRTPSGQVFRFCVCVAGSLDPHDDARVWPAVSV